MYVTKNEEIIFLCALAMQSVALDHAFEKSVCIINNKIENRGFYRVNLFNSVERNKDIIIFYRIRKYETNICVDKF